MNTDDTGAHTTRGEDDPHKGEEELHVREPWWSVNFPILVLLGMFLFTALFIPVEWIKSLQKIMKSDPVNVHATFADRTAVVDQMLERGEVVRSEELSRLEYDLMLRRLLRAGPMSEPHLKKAKEMLLEMQRQIAVEKNRSGRVTLRHAHARKIAREFPRLDAARVTEELDSLAAQIERNQALLDAAK